MTVLVKKNGIVKMMIYQKDIFWRNFPQFSQSCDRLVTDAEGIVDLGLEKLAGLVRVGQAKGLGDGLGQDLLQDGTSRRI